MTCGIDSEMEQRYSEAQIPDLVANAIPQVLEAEKSRCEALSRTGGLSVFGYPNCAFGCAPASNSKVLIFASSSAASGAREVREVRNSNELGILGGY